LENALIVYGHARIIVRVVGGQSQHDLNPLVRKGLEMIGGFDKSTSVNHKWLVVSLLATLQCGCMMTERPQVMETHQLNPPLRSTGSPAAPLLDRQIFRLWDDAAPYAQGDADDDIPTLQAYLPPAGKATGAAIIVYPGGGYTHLSPREGPPAAEWLAANGITAFVLKYRLGPKYHHPAEMADGQRSIRFVRAHAAAWNIDPNRIGVIGFSAGGHLASTVATHFTPGDPMSADPVVQVSSRPDLQILLYPVITFTDEPNVHKGSRASLLGDNPPPALMELLSNEKQVSANTPPAFVVHSTADKVVPVANSDAYVAALMRFNIPVVYLRANYGGHGFGLTDAWTHQCIDWLRTQKY
jgi:acetyl esterase/lipase